MQEKLEILKNKPQHVRENIAIGISGGITLLVFIGWAGSMAQSHRFAISPIKETPGVESPLAKASDAKDSFSNLLGAVGGAGGKGTSTSNIQIIDSPAPKEESTEGQTVIHF